MKRFFLMLIWYRVFMRVLFSNLPAPVEEVTGRISFAAGCAHRATAHFAAWTEFYKLQ